MNFVFMLFGSLMTMGIIVGSSYVVGIQIKKLDKFIGVFNILECDKRSKEDMVKCALKLWIFMSVLAALSSSLKFMWFAVIPLWFGTAYIMYRFLRVWAANKFPMFRLLLFTTAILAVSFSVSPFIEYGIGAL